MGRNEHHYNMLNELVLKSDLQVNIAKKYRYSESYISQIAKKIRLLKYKPKIIDGELVCYKCGKKNGKMDIHHTIDDEYIAIVCHSCNVKIGKNELEFESNAVKKSRKRDIGLEIENEDLKKKLSIIQEKALFLYDLLSNFGLKTDPDDFTWTKIEKLNTFMEALKTANNER